MKITDLLFCLSLTSAIPGITYLFQLPKIGTSYIIILGYSILATLIELINHSFGIHSPMIVNLFVLIDALVFYVLLSKWQPQSLYSKRYIIIPILISTWIGTTIFLDIHERNAIFKILYSFLLVIGSINVINQLLFENKSLYKEFRFIICISLLFFYTFNIIVEAFCLIGMKFSVSFTLNLYFVKVAFNILGNLLIAFAILCIPRKPRFILSF